MQAASLTLELLLVIILQAESVSTVEWSNVRPGAAVGNRLATSVWQVRRDQKEPDPTGSVTTPAYSY